MGDETKIVKKLEQVAAKAANNPAFAKELAGFAIDALFNGVGSTQWETYMRQIVGNDSPKQLARLTNKNAMKNDPDLRKNSIYMVANAVCGTGTTTKTLQGVGPEVDAA